MKKLEICCYSLESALIAEKAGANRIELCDNYSEGGTTPSYATIKHCISKLNIPVNVLVRPRGGDFLYTPLEYDIIKEDMIQIKELGANGIVIGFLLPNGEVDIEKTKEIVDLAFPMEVTFHRAFDMCNNVQNAMNQLKKIGISRILTSGTYMTAYEGSGIIANLIKKANNEIIIMPGSGINENNLEKILVETNAKEFHASAKSFTKSTMQFQNKKISMNSTKANNEYLSITTNPDSIKKMIKTLIKYP